MQPLPSKGGDKADKESRISSPDYGKKISATQQQPQQQQQQQRRDLQSRGGLNSAGSAQVSV